MTSERACVYGSSRAFSHEPNAKRWIERGREEGRKEGRASSRRTSSSEFKGSKILVTVSRAILLVCGIRTPLQSAKERAGESSAAPLVNKRNAPALKVVG